jgi:hypothetical protein
MLSHSVILMLSILGIASILSLFPRLQYYLSIPLTMGLSEFVASFKYYINMGYVGPFEMLGIWLDLLISFPLSVVAVLGFGKLRELLEQVKWINHKIVSVALFAIFMFFPILRYSLPPVGG